VAEQLSGGDLVPVRTFLGREVALLALVAFATDDRERHDHAIVDF
jgi:hypothetical protein